MKRFPILPAKAGVCCALNETASRDGGAGVVLPSASALVHAVRK